MVAAVGVEIAVIENVNRAVALRQVEKNIDQILLIAGDQLGHNGALATSGRIVNAIGNASHGPLIGDEIGVVRWVNAQKCLVAAVKIQDEVRVVLAVNHVNAALFLQRVQGPVKGVTA